MIGLLSPHTVQTEIMQRLLAPHTQQLTALWALRQRFQRLPSFSRARLTNPRYAL